MAPNADVLRDQTFDALPFNLESLNGHSELSEVVTAFLEGDYKAVLRSPTSQTLYGKLVETISLSRDQQDANLQEAGFQGEVGAVQVLITGLAAFNAFLQANVTGPPTDWGNVFPKSGVELALREQCLKCLDVDGVSVYQHIPHVELFSLARLIFTVFFPRIIGGEFRDCKWMRVRINAYHQRLLSGLSGGNMSDFSVLQDVIEKDLRELEVEIMGEKSVFGTEAKVQFLLEKAQIYIMQGLDIKAKENVRMAKTVSGFSYALSGALGKRTKFQQNDISQLVVFARSRESEKSSDGLSDAMKDSKLSNGGERSGPTALDLNDDTLLESIEFAKSDKIDNSALPPELKELRPDSQPQLKPLDQITLLTEATLKDTLSPLDKLNSEEILPYAVRVLSDKPTNWQIYTQALLVRSRIESHRSRTQERSVLQLQVIVDQIIADTQEEPSPESDGVPEIRVTQFLPRAKESESAPVSERLKYIFQLNTPTRWEIETELAYAWSGAGSFVSALEIFKRLKLWAEVALCYHSVGQEDKARQIIRRQLFFSSKGAEMDQYGIDAEEVVKEKWDGEIRPTPPHAPRLWCILGDLDNDPTCWERSWTISKKRYARAQRSLGEYWTKEGDLEKARDAYMAATIVNRQNNDTWSRLGDIDLRVGNWDGAVVAFQQSIMIDDTDAKTYSNLGSALLSKHAEMMKLQKAQSQGRLVPAEQDEEEDQEVDFAHEKAEDPKAILFQALKAYKRAASLAHDNWKIWDNVITIAGRLSPPSFPDLLLGFRSVLRIRGPSVGEAAVDSDILRALVGEVTSSERPENPNAAESPEMNKGIYIPPRGSLARALITMIDEEVVPLITKRAELWVLVEKLSLYRRDYAGALRCAERAWRMVSGGEEWLVEKEAWKGVVGATDNLEVERAWRSKARAAVKGIMGRGRDGWEGSEGWETLEGRLEELKG
ncbi:TPR-like protein [Hyaloscypha hepaticicola]|uniref:TPR-like protein n=1 Tax=Hyaloscypha hepaticicola TaxID=2082293 RepID=A0A2J6PY89_9HELO|nr:TPR-like protein [Hyaloscypha hepaticicola]